MFLSYFVDYLSTFPYANYGDGQKKVNGFLPLLEKKLRNGFCYIQYVLPNHVLLINLGSTISGYSVIVELVYR